MRGKQKFKTFANSPLSYKKSNFPSSIESVSPANKKSKQPSPFEGQSPSRHYQQHTPSHKNIKTSNIDELKRQMQQALKSQRKQTGQERKNMKKYPTQVSLMKSNISIASTMLNEDLPLDLLSLEFNLTQNILGLRQEKITLMEEYNKQIGEKYKVERQISKLEKLPDPEPDQTGDDLVDSKNTQKMKQIDPILIKNQFLKRQYHELQQIDEQNSKFSGRNQEIILAIEELQNKSRLLELQLNKLLEKSGQTEDKRFQTFFPEDKGKKNIALLRELDQLRSFKNQIRQKLAQNVPIGAKNALLSLIQENNNLKRRCDEILYSHTNGRSLNELKRKIESEERAKEVFLKDLKIFKEEMKRLQEQNQILRRA